MKEFKALWRKTKDRTDKLEKQVVNTYIAFLREVAMRYLKKGRKVFFRENLVVHYGEGGFGRLIIEGDEGVREVFGEYILEIRFEPKFEGKGYIEIEEENLDDIKYSL